MSKNETRVQLGVHLGRRQRKKIRQKLLEAFGTCCCWCGDEMEIPTSGTNIRNMEEMATVEHHFAKDQDLPDSLMLLRLSHKRCNR
jgi:hypothetical protein